MKVRTKCTFRFFKIDKEKEKAPKMRKKKKMFGKGTSDRQRNTT